MVRTSPRASFLLSLALCLSRVILKLTVLLRYLLSDSQLPVRLVGVPPRELILLPPSHGLSLPLFLLLLPPILVSLEVMLSLIFAQLSMVLLEFLWLLEVYCLRVRWSLLWLLLLLPRGERRLGAALLLLEELAGELRLQVHVDVDGRRDQAGVHLVLGSKLAGGVQGGSLHGGLSGI